MRKETNIMGQEVEVEDFIPTFAFGLNDKPNYVLRLHNLILTDKVNNTEKEVYSIDLIPIDHTKEEFEFGKPVDGEDIHNRQPVARLVFCNIGSVKAFMKIFNKIEDKWN